MRLPLSLIPAALPVVLALATAPAAAFQPTAIAGSVTLTLDERHLAALGIRVAGARGADIAPPLYTFTVRRGAGSDATAGDGNAGDAGDAARVRVEGGLVLAVHDMRTGDARDPLYLFDFEVLPSSDAGRNATIRTADPAVPLPLDVRDGDLRITAEWARRMGRPELAGERIGSLLTTPGPAAAGAQEPDGAAAAHAAPPVPAPGGGAPDHPRDGPGLDLELAELYQLTSQGRDGISYPNGTTGFSVTTTVCNVGQVPVPWVGPGFSGPMGEAHPFLGLAMYRESPAGVLEMIGTSWLKHSFNVLASDKCGLGCPGATSGQLNVGCSDTYNTSDNADRFYLGPREELDPYAATWESCGSFFDALPADCERSYFGFEPSAVTHRLAVTDADLDVPGARFFYEAIYYVEGDVYPWNGAGWRECLVALLGGGWSVTTPGGNAPQHGPLAASWGDKRSTGPVARNDGEVVLSVRVSSLGGGQWHYEYVLFNWRSRSGVGALEIPVGGANVSNVGFRDLNGPGADDWTAVVAGGAVRWSTAAQPLRYQTMFNFRFDADAPPGDAFAVAEAFDPGIGRGFPFATHAPAAAVPRRDGDAGADAGAETAAEGGPALAIAGVNPTGGDAAVAVTLPRPAAARITVTDAAGRTVRVLADRALPAGRTELHWDGRDSGGAPVAAGVYFVRLIAGGASRTEKITRLR